MNLDLENLAYLNDTCEIEIDCKYIGISKNIYDLTLMGV